MVNILLGPLLGVESDTKYSVCILVAKEVERPELYVSTLKESVGLEYEEILLEKFRFCRFSFELPLSFSGEFEYQIKCKEETLKSQNEFYFWKVAIGATSAEPNVAFVSCNGRDDIPVEQIPLQDYEGWKELVNQKPNYLFLTGDQVYTDTVFQKIPDLANLLINPDSATLIKIECFFLDLYIKSWQNHYLALALATIPNVMTWDDHDIIDGYGSFNEEIQAILKPFFEIARKYYALFQLRCHRNQTIKSSPGLKDLNQIILLRNFLFILPDTRTYRTQNCVLKPEQYSFLENYKVNQLNKLQKKKYSLVFVLPVPIAHLDFFGIVENIIDYFDRKKGNTFHTFNSDDALDHWDHRFHKEEQKSMLNLIFDYGSILESKHVIIISGDVHSAGASTVFRMDDKPRCVTQLITSPIVNKPAPWYLRIGGSRFKLVGDFGCDLKNFGSSRFRMFCQRNFMILGKSDGVLKATLHVAQNNTWENVEKNYRNINLFEGGKAKIHFRLKSQKIIRDFFSNRWG